MYKIINDAYGNVGSIELTKEDNTKISSFVSSIEPTFP